MGGRVIYNSVSKTFVFGIILFSNAKGLKIPDYVKRIVPILISKTKSQYLCVFEIVFVYALYGL